MKIYGVVFESNPNELVRGPWHDGLYLDEGEARKFCDGWNSDVGLCETRVVIVVPLEVKGK